MKIALFDTAETTDALLVITDRNEAITDDCIIAWNGRHFTYFDTVREVKQFLVREVIKLPYEQGEVSVGG